MATLDRQDPRDYKAKLETLTTGSQTTPPPYPPLTAQTFEGEFGPAKHQTDPSCAIHGTLACLEHEWFRLSDWSDKIALSAQFVFWCARQIVYPRGDGPTTGQLGVSQREALKALKIYGACPENLWTERVMAFQSEPPADRFIHALKYRVKRYGTVAPAMLKTALQVHVSVAAIVDIYSGWNAPELMSPDGGISPAPVTTLPIPALAGYWISYHSICLCGFDDTRGCWRIRNSWGSEWCDRGHAWLPFEYTLRDLWTITEVTL